MNFVFLPDCMNKKSMLNFNQHTFSIRLYLSKACNFSGLK